ncbi:hypothetical protein TNCV_1326251 [Trichonephila clavipes]|nr:hypothetical protein TNCV_1326251 [Trichonephila clavipes]
MTNEPVKPHHAVTFGECNGFCVYSCVIRGRPNATVMVVNCNHEARNEFSSVHKMFKIPGGILFHFREGPLRKCFLLCGICCAKVHGTIAICMGTAGGFDKEYCGQMMVVKPKSSGSFTATVGP